MSFIVMIMDVLGTIREESNTMELFKRKSTFPSIETHL